MEDFRFGEGLLLDVDWSRNLTSKFVGSRIGLSGFSMGVGAIGLGGNEKLCFSVWDSR